MWHVTAHRIEQYRLLNLMSDDFESETVLTDEMTGDEAMPIIQNLTEHLVPPFEQLFDEISD